MESRKLGKGSGGVVVSSYRALLLIFTFSTKNGFGSMSCVKVQYEKNLFKRKSYKKSSIKKSSIKSHFKNIVYKIWIKSE